MTMCKTHLFNIPRFSDFHKIPLKSLVVSNLHFTRHFHLNRWHIPDAIFNNHHAQKQTV